MEYEPVYGKKTQMPYAISQHLSCDHPAQMRRLISYFVVHFLDCNVIVSISKILSHYVPDTIIAEFTNIVDPNETAQYELFAF